MSDPEFNPDDFLAAPEQQAEFDPDAFIGEAPAQDGFGELTPLPVLPNQPDEFDKMMPGGFETDLVSPTATRFARTYVQAPPEDLSAYPKTKDAVERESRISGLAKAAHAIGAGFDQATTWLAKKLTEASPEEAQALGEFAKQQQEMGSFLPSAVTGESLREALGGLAAIDVTPKKVLQLDNAEAARIRGEGAFAIAAQRNIEAQRQLQASELSFQEAMAAVEGRLVPDITAQREELEAQLPLDLREEGVAGVLADITSGSESTLQAAAEGAKVAGPGVAIGLVAGAVTKNPALARTVVMNSAKFGGLAGAANFTFRQEAGSTFKETADWKGSDGKPLSLQERAGAAIVTGLVNTGIEIGSDLIALYKLEPALAAVAGGESSLRAQVARDPRLRAMLVRAAKTWVQASTPEVLEEGAQAVAGQAVHAAVSQDLSVFSPSEAVDAMGQSIVPMFLGVGVVGPVLHVAAESSLRHEYQKAGQRVAPLLQLAADADMQASPAEFVAVAEKVGAGPVYVRGEAVKRFFQERSEDVGEQQRQLEEALGPGAVEKVETAAATGGSVEISLEALPQWAKHEASGALVDDSSTHPEAPTPRELRAGGAAVEEAAQKLASEELAKHADGLAFEKVVDRWVVEQVAAGQPKGQAKVAAMVLRHLVATAAKDSGKSPMEIARSAEFHFLPGDEQPMPAQAPTAPDIETFLTNRLQSQDPMAEAGKAALVKDFFIDAATGVRNRRFWDLEKKTAVAVGIISIEGVKFQNDKFGHQAGDALYAAAAQALAQSGLDNGTLSRPGGDFAIANVTQEQLDAALERANLNPVLRGYRLSGHVAQTHEQTPEKDLTRVAAEKHNAAKKALEEAGQRALRGAKPLGAVDEAQMQARPVEGSVVSEARTADLLALDQEQQFQQQYTEPATGLLTKDARDRYLSAHPKKYHVSLDLNLLKAYNELIGDAGGDALIEAYGKLITELGGREFLATHVSGDEYTLDTDDLEGAQAFLEVLRNAAENHDIKVTLKDGSTGLVPGVTFGVGVGPTIDLAEEQLNADKERLAVEGKRGRDFEGSLAIASQNLARGSDLLARRSGEGGTGAQGTAGAVSGTQEAGAPETTGPAVGDGGTTAGHAVEGPGAGRIEEFRQQLEGAARDEFDRVLSERSSRGPVRSDEAELLFAGLNSDSSVKLARALVAARPEGDWKLAASARLDWVENLSTARTRTADGRSVVVPDSVWNAVDEWMRDPVRRIMDPEDGVQELVWRSEHPGKAPPWQTGPRLGGSSRWTDKGMQTRADAQREEFDRNLHGSAQADKRRYQANTLRTGEEALPKQAQSRIDATRAKTRPVAQALEERARAMLKAAGFKSGVISQDDRSDKAKDVIANWMADEVAFEADPARGPDSGIGWYSQRWQDALDVLKGVFPELEQAPMRGLFTALTAITSDGQKVTTNLGYAVKLFESFRATGKLDAGAISSNRNMTANVARINKMIDDMGLEAMLAHLLREGTVEQLQQNAKTLGIDFKTQYEPSVKLPMAALVFGPKLGAFFGNLSGATGYLTMDRWWSRTFNRMRGDLVTHATPQGLGRLRALLGDPAIDDDALLFKAAELRSEYEDRGFKPDFGGAVLDAAKAAKVYEAESATDRAVSNDKHYGLAVSIWAKAGKEARAKYDPEGKYTKTPPPAFVKARAAEANAKKKATPDAPMRRAKQALGNFIVESGGADPEVVARNRGYVSAREMFDRFELERAANTVIKGEFIDLNDTPANPKDRTFMIETAQLAQSKLAKRGIDISVADIQAALWYYEKRLYSDLGAKESADESYLEAAKTIVGGGVESGRSAAQGARAVDSGAGAGAGEAGGRGAGRRGRLAQVATEEDKATTPNQKIMARVEEILREYLMVEGIPGIESSQADEVRFNHDDQDLSDPLISVLQFPNPELPKTSANSLMRDVRLSRIVQAIGQPNLARDSALYVQALRNESERERATEEWSRESKVFEAWKSLDPIHPGWLLVLDHEAVLVRPGMDDVLFANADAADQAWAAEPIRSVDVEKTEWKDGYLEDKQNIPNKQVELTPRWYQDENTGEVPKGYFDGAEQVATGQVLRVFLNKSADISTTLHEVSHAWLEFYRQLATAADATDAVKKKYAAIETWLGVEAGAEFTKAQHEKFARTFEQYLLEGKAPKAGLERAFNSIKRWMLAIYRTARGVPGADLNEQSRRVFDALLATQDEVEAYQRAQGLADQKKPATVTAEEWQAQLEAQRDAVSEGSRKAELRAVKDALRVHERWWKDGVKKLRKVFADEYQQLPGVRAARFLRDAKLKLDPFDLPDNAGQIADTLGFASIDDLVRALAEIPDEKTWVEEHAEDEMRQQHPGILERRDDMRAAVADGLNAYTEKRLLDERANLRKHDPRIGAAPIAMLRRAAELIVARTTLAKLNAGLALAREAKAAKEAYEAAAKGKWADAAKANQQQLLNHFLYRELMAARDLRTNLENTAAKASKKASRERLGKASEHYRNAVDFILGKLVLAAPIDGLDSGTLQQVAGQLQGDAVIVGDPEWLPDLIEATRADTYKDLTVAQGLAVLDALTQIQHAARMRTEATVEGKKIDEDELAAHLVNEAKSNKRQQGLLPSSPSAATFAQRLAGMPDAFSAPLLKIETMVDWLGGALVGKDPQSSWWYKAVFKPLEAARQRESDLFKSRLKPIDAAMNAIPKSVRKTWMDPIDGAQLFPQHKAGDVAPPSRRFELLVMALNAGTPSSLERLTLGRSITVDQVQAALGLLTKEEIDWVNAVGEAFDGMWPEIAAMEERVTGLRPQALERRAMVLRNGVLDGHYFPAIYDSRATVAGEKQDESKVAALFEGGFSGFGTQHGHTKARVDGFYAAISLEPGAIMTHLAQAVHDLALREPVMEVGRRILRSEVNDALKSSLGIERAKQFRLWAKDAALGSVRSSEHAGALLKFARKLKANTTIAALGYSVPNFFEDMSALPSALADRELEAPSLMRGLKTFLSNPMQALDEVRRISPVMRAADDSLQRDLMQKIGELTATGPYSRGPLKWIREHAFALIEASYNATATPIWIGMYQQAVEKGDGHSQAVDRADRLVRRLFPQHNIVNAAGIVRDRGGIGFMLQFYGFQSTALQNVYSNVQQMYESPDAKMKMRAAGRTLGYFLAISLIGAFLRGRGPDKDEEVSSWALRTLLTSGIQMLPLGSDFANVMDAWLGGRQSPSRPSSALTATIDAVARAVVVLASDKEDGKKVEAALRAAGPLLGLPTSQAIRTGKYVSDVVSGDRAPGGPGDVVSGLIYGESDRRQWTPFNTPGRIMEPR